MALTLPKVECTGLQMKVFQGILAPCLSTTDVLCQLPSVPMALVTRWYKSAFVHYSLFHDRTCRLGLQLRRVPLAFRAAQLQLEPTQGHQNCDVHGRRSMSTRVFFRSAYWHQPKAEQSCRAVLVEEWATLPGFPGTLEHVYQNKRGR